MARTTSVALLTLALILGLFSDTLAQPAPAGTVSRLEGTAAVARTSAPQPAALKLRDSVYLHDLVTTGEQSRAQMLLGGRATVTMRERSSLRITEVPGVATLDLSDGRLKLAVKKGSLQPGDRIEVKTPNAVTAVRGTVVVVEVLRTAAGVTSRVTVLDGSVEVSSLDPVSGRPRGAPATLGRLQQVDVVAGAGAPGVPQTMARADVERLDATFAFALKAGSAASADLLGKHMERAASDAAAAQGSADLAPPGTHGTTPSVSGDSLRLRGGAIGPAATGGGPNNPR